MLVHLTLNDLTPSYLKALLSPVSSNPGRSSLRSATSGDLLIPQTRLKMCERAFSVFAPREWNNLPHSIRSIKNTACFKKNLKTFLFNESYGDFSCNAPLV